MTDRGHRHPRPHPEHTAWERMGGLAGLIESSLPSVVFVGTQSLLGLDAAIACAVGAAIALTAVRRVRRQSLRPALGGFVGVAVSSFLAHHTGAARDYFLPDIWISLCSFLILAGSILVRRPLVGVLWSSLNHAPTAWRHDRRSRLGYDLATGVLAGTFAVRFLVQRSLYEQHDAGAMAVAKIVVNYPLWGLALCVVVWAVRRADTRLSSSSAAGGPDRATTAPDVTPGAGEACASWSRRMSP